MVNVRCARKIRGLVGDVPGQRVRVVSAGKGLAKRSRLNDTLIGKVFVRWSHNAQSRRCLVASRHAGRLCGELVHSLVLASIWSVTLCRLLLQASLDDLALLLPHAQTTLQLLLHGGVLCDEAGRQTGEANLHDSESVSFARKSSRLCSRAGQTTLGEIELSRSVAGRRDHWRTWFLLDDDPGGSGAGYISTETFSDVRICATKRIQNETWWWATYVLGDDLFCWPAALVGLPLPVRVTFGVDEVAAGRVAAGDVDGGGARATAGGALAVVAGARSA